MPVGLAAQQRDELGEVAGGEVALHQQQHGPLHQRGNGGEVAHRIEGQAAVQRGVGGMADVVEEERVAVLGRLGDGVRANGAAGSGAVLDDHPLAEPGGELLGEQAGQGVGRAAGGEGQHHADRPGGPCGLRGGGARLRDEGGGGEAGEQGATMERGHLFSSF